MRRYFLKLVLFLLAILVSDRLLSRAFATALQKHYGLDRPAAVLFIGHSRTDLGIDRSVVEQELKMPTVKYALGGTSVFDRYAMIKNYFSRNPESVKYVVYDVDYSTFYPKSALSTNSYRNLYPFMDKEQVDEYLRHAAQSESEYAARKIVHLLRFDSTLINNSIRTLLGMSDKPYTNKMSIGSIDDFSKKRCGMDDRPIFDANTYKCFLDTIDYVVGHGAVMVLVKSPLPDFVLQANRNNDSYAGSIFETVAKSHKKVVLVDRSRLFSKEYRLFNDPFHLNKDGQHAFSLVVARDLEQLSRAGRPAASSPAVAGLKVTRR